MEKNVLKKMFCDLRNEKQSEIWNSYCEDVLSEDYCGDDVRCFQIEDNTEYVFTHRFTYVGRLLMYAQNSARHGIHYSNDDLYLNMVIKDGDYCLQSATENISVLMNIDDKFLDYLEFWYSKGE